MPLSIQDNLFAIHEAFEARTLVLLVPTLGSVPASFCSVAGQVMMDWLHLTERLSPSYWLATGAESDDAVKSLDWQAETRPIAFFKLVFAPQVLDDAVMPTSDDEIMAIAQEAKKRCCIIRSKSIMTASDIVIENLGRWAYAMREKQQILEEKNKRPSRLWVPASIVVS